MIAERDFRRLLGAQFVAQAADGAAHAAFAVDLVLDPVRAGTPGRILALFAFSLVPYSLLAPFMGVFVDRWSRRGLMVWTNVARALLATGLAIATMRGDVPEPVLYVSVLVVLGLGRLFLTTKGALLPAVLHERALLPGNALSGGGGMVSALAGGVIGLAAAGVADTGGTFAVVAVAYALSSVVARTLSSAYAHPRARTRGIRREIAEVARDLGDGVTTVLASVRARLALVGIFCLRTAGMVVVVGAILIIKQRYPGAEGHDARLEIGALAVGTAGVGAGLAALAASRLGARIGKARMMLVGFVVSGAGILALGGVAALPAVLSLTLLGGFAGFLAKVSVDAQLQEALPDDHRGRAFALYDILYNLASVAAAGVIVVFEESSLRTVLASAGVVCLFLAAALARRFQRAGLLEHPAPEIPAADPGGRS